MARRSGAITRRTSGKSQLLEQAVDTFHALGFQIYDGFPVFQKAMVVGERYVIRNYPCPTIYGTRGRKEAYVVAPAGEHFLPDEDGRARILIEAKWQEVSGSKDEAMPFVWLSFLESDVPNWVVIMDGAYWKTARGKAVVKWMSGRPTPEGRRWYVLTRKEFIALATEAWRAS